MSINEWIKTHNIPELLRLCLENIKVNGDYTAFTGLETTSGATVQVQYDGTQITMQHVSVGDVAACLEELKNVKNQLKKAQQEIKSQDQKIEELESQIETSTAEVTVEPVVTETSRKRKG